MRHHMGVDLETRSGADISKTGSYKYAQDPDFKILLFGYRLDDGPVEVIDLTQGDGRLPDRIVTLLQRPDVTKHAYNAQFEWYCLQRAGYDTPLEQWECTMVHGLYLGYPAGLARIGAALGLKDDELKLSTGKALIRYFCVPNRPTKSFPGGYHSPEDDPDRWDLFKRYNERDVLSETQIWRVLRQFPVPPSEWELWRADVRMNALGVRVDRDLVAGALTLNDTGTERMLAESKEITGLDNPNSQAQLLPWLQEHGCDITDIRKETIDELLSGSDLDPDVRRVLELRRLLGKTSVKKYEAMRVLMGEGDRVRGISQFYGANRSGRYAGRLVQMQNLTKNHIDTLDEARRIVKTGDYDLTQAIYGNVPDLLSQLVRTAFIPSDGRHFVVADFSAIEARVLAWLAGEQWVSDVFAAGRDIYCETASAMFGVPVEKHGANAELRQRGKVATLALGYQGGPAAMIAMGALRMGIPEEDLPDIVTKWRDSRPKTVRMWYELERAAVQCVSTGEAAAPDCDGPAGRIIFRLEIDPLYGKRYLTMELPSMRKLYYVDPQLRENKFGRMAIHYRGTEQSTGRWGTESTYGGKLCENCLSGETLIVTNHGAKRITDVTFDDLLWDGIEWVSHDGVVRKGRQRVIDVNGVRMTPDHKVLTNGGWINASQSERYNRNEEWLSDGCFIRGIGREKVNLEHSVRLRKDHRDAGVRVPERKTEVLRLYERTAYFRETCTPRNDRHANLECMAFDDRAVHDSDSASLEELRRQRNYSMRGLEDLREFLQGYGSELSDWANPGPDRCKRPILQTKLQMGNDERTVTEQKKHQVHRYADRTDHRQRSCGEIGDRLYDNTVPDGARLADRFTVRETGCTEPVYDIMNSGPRHRFSVVSNDGIMIVHNCVQGIARDCLCEVLRRIIARGWDVVFHVHDEVIVDAPLGVHTDDLCALMAEPIDWAPGLLLQGAGFEAMYYKKD